MKRLPDRRMRRGPLVAKQHTGVPADHFTPAPSALSPAKALKMVRAELARRRKD